jgi:protein-tyrosine phosphatase
MKTDHKKMWMLYAEGGSSPTVKHEDYLTALMEAKRLMENKQLARVYIMEAIGVVEAEVIRNLHHMEIKYGCEQEQMPVVNP